MAFEIFLKPVIALPVILALCYFVYTYVTAKSNLPDLPWVGASDGQWFAKGRARIGNTFKYQAAIQCAYDNYSKKGLSCIVPSIEVDVILLPASSTEWIINQPELSLSVVATHVEALQSDFTFADPVIVRQPYHEHIVKTDLTRQLGSLTMDIMDELASGFDETWGFDTRAWKEIGVFENMMRIIARTSNRVMVGLPLCRNAGYLSSVSGYAQSVIPAAAILRQFPEGLRPMVAKVVTLPNKYFIRKTAQFLEPEIKSRLAEIDRQSNDLEKKAAETEPNDFLQWLIKYAQERLPPPELSPHIIAGRMLALNFAAIHTSTFGVTNIIFDLVSSDPSLNYISQLREEAAAILTEDGGIWTKRGLSKMHKIDSTIRESLRIRSFLSAGLVRKVVAPNGITTPDGVYCPFGSHVGIGAMGVHGDNAIYPEAAQFQPFRYVDAREAITANVETGKFGTEEMIKKANYATVSTSADYLSFGHGRHACPGRFFAANELKLLLAYMVLNYDIEPLEKRPDGKWVGTVCLPDMKATIKVRRRNVNQEKA